MKPAGKLNEVRINEIDLDVVSQGRPEELNIVVDSDTVPAVIVSNLVNYVPASVSSPMKQSECAQVYSLPAAGTQIRPVCPVPLDEIELEPTLGPPKLVVSATWVDARPPVYLVSHPYAFPAEPLPADVAALAVSAHEVELVSIMRFRRWPGSLRRFCLGVEPLRRSCHSGSTRLCFLLRPANRGSTHRVKRKVCEKVWYECGTHDHAREMKGIFEGWRVAEDPIQAISDEGVIGGSIFQSDRCFRASGVRRVSSDPRSKGYRVNN